VHVPDANVVFSGDIVEYKSACYCGDAHLTNWPTTLARLGAFRTEALVPGRGEALAGVDQVAEGIALTGQFLRDLYEPVKRGVARGAPLKECFDAATEAMRPKYGSWPIFEHCQPFNVARAYDEAQGIDMPRIWNPFATRHSPQVMRASESLGPSSLHRSSRKPSPQGEAVRDLGGQVEPREASARSAARLRLASLRPG
jgi:hypothetical protein